MDTSSAPWDGTGPTSGAGSAERAGGSARTATPGDRWRQVVVAVSAVLAVVGSAIGSGAFGGTQVQESSGGALAADATLIAPAGPAFSIWSVIYAGLVVLAVQQALPRAATDPRHRATGWWVAASMLLNAAWILAVQAGLLGLSVVVIAALLAVLSVVLVRYLRVPAATRAAQVVTEATIGLYLGWVSVATLANVTAVLVSAEVGELGLGATAWSVVVLAAAAALAVAYAVVAAGRPLLALAVGAAMCWGLAWIAVARSTGGPIDSVTATAAGVAAAVAILAPVVTVLRARRRTA